MQQRKVFALILKPSMDLIVYKTLKELCANHVLGISKGTLDRKDFDLSDFENNECMIKKRYIQPK